MEEIMGWLGDVFYIERSETTVKTGYTSERIYSGTSYTLVRFPYEETATTTTNVFNWQAGCAFILVCMVFLTVVTWFRGVLK